MKPLPEESAAVGVWVRPICHGGSGDRPWQILPWSIPNSFFFFFNDRNNPNMGNLFR